MEKDQELGLYDDWDNTLMDGLEDEPFEVDVISTIEKEPELRTVYIEKPVEVIKEVIKEVPVEVIKEVIKEVPVEAISNTVNQTSSTVKLTKGPLYKYRTNIEPVVDKNADEHID